MARTEEELIKEHKEHLDHACVAEFHVLAVVGSPVLAVVQVTVFDLTAELALVVLLGFGLVPRGVFPRDGVQ